MYSPVTTRYPYAASYPGYSASGGYSNGYGAYLNAYGYPPGYSNWSASSPVVAHPPRDFWQSNKSSQPAATSLADTSVSATTRVPDPRTLVEDLKAVGLKLVPASAKVDSESSTQGKSRYSPSIIGSMGKGALVGAALAAAIPAAITGLLYWVSPYLRQSLSLTWPGLVIGGAAMLGAIKGATLGAIVGSVMKK